MESQRIYKGETYTLFNCETLNEGDVLYKFDPDNRDLPPLKLTTTNICVMEFQRGEEIGYFDIEYPKSVLEKWKTKYGTKRKWKNFTSDMKKSEWYCFGGLYIKNN